MGKIKKQTLKVVFFLKFKCLPHLEITNVHVMTDMIIKQAYMNTTHTQTQQKPHTYEYVYTDTFCKVQVFGGWSAVHAG